MKLGVFLIPRIRQLWSGKPMFQAAAQLVSEQHTVTAMVFPGSFLNEQMALNATTGAVVWDTLTKGPMIFDGAYSDGRFLRGGTDDNTMYCFNATNGQILWTYTPQDTDGYFTTGPAISYGMVYEMNKDGYLYAFNIETGDLVWKYKGPDSTLLWPGMPYSCGWHGLCNNRRSRGIRWSSRHFPVCMFERLHWAAHLDASYRSISSKRICCYCIWQLIHHSRQRNNFG